MDKKGFGEKEIMANISKQKRDRMLAFLEELKKTHSDDASIRAFNEIENHLREKKYGLVWEEHTEEVDEMLQENIPVFCEDKERRLCKDENLPWNFIIEGDNLQALYLLEKTHRGKVDCIYIDPPYNTGAKDWKYNNDYVDGNDVYRHSKWLSMMKNRLLLAKNLLNSNNSVLICTIDEKEYLRLGCLLEELFPTAKIQMISSAIKPSGSTRETQFSRVDEYIFFVQLGSAYPQNSYVDMLYDNPEEIEETSVTWQGLRRRGSDGWKRANSPGGFYPIYINSQTNKLHSIGDAIPLEQDRKTVVPPCGTYCAWPLDPQGREGRWQIKPERLREQIEEGTAFLSQADKTKGTCSIKYLKDGDRNRVLNGEFLTKGKDVETGALIIIPRTIANRRPKTMWLMKSHDASAYGTTLLNKFIGEQKFSFPKSLYAVMDALRFFIVDKPDALVLDFFAGSGTTLHAVNLLNAEIGGQRKCILVTNNEVSLEEEKSLTKKGYKKGDAEWETFGIAKYITWPRTVCSIEGKNLLKQPIKGDYLVKDSQGKFIPISQGFKANVKYLKCDWTPRKPEDYLLSNALCLHIKEMIELQTGREIDGKKNVLILNRDDFNEYINNAEVYNGIENIWLNQNMILSSDEMKLLNEKGFKYIPREYFGQELREAAE